MKLKRWESPRRQGRNDKGRGGSARAKQIRKQQQRLRQKLKDSSQETRQNRNLGKEIDPSSIFLSE